MRDRSYLPVWIKKDAENLRFGNGVLVVDFIDNLHDWIDGCNLGDVRKNKYKHYVVYHSMNAVSIPLSDAMFKKHPDIYWKPVVDYVLWLSKKLKKDLPEDIKNIIIAYSL